MEAKGKREGLTRRDFIKTIGLAGIASTGLDARMGSRRFGTDRRRKRRDSPGASWAKRAWKCRSWRSEGCSTRSTISCFSGRPSPGVSISGTPPKVMEMV